MRSNWYKKFLKEIKELETTLKCPECGSELIMHVNPVGYDFICSTCGKSFEYEEGIYKSKFKNVMHENN